MAKMNTATQTNPKTSRYWTATNQHTSIAAIIKTKERIGKSMMYFKTLVPCSMNRRRIFPPTKRNGKNPRTPAKPPNTPARSSKLQSLPPFAFALTADNTHCKQTGSKHL